VQTIPTFPEVKALLDHLVKGKEDNLHLYHGSNFKWTTKTQLLNATVVRNGQTYQLIDPILIGSGSGDQSYLVRALTCRLDLDGDGVDDVARMPYRGNIDGEYARVSDLAMLVAWIDAGCPD
jgi:hypothetical protein